MANHEREQADALRIGLYMVNQHPPGADMRATLAEQVDLLHAARDGGWDSVWAGHHYLSTGMQMLHPVPFLAYVVREAGEMALGTAILLLTIENPVAIAEAFATIDVMCDGRLSLGAGLGYRDVEFDAFGVDRSERVRRFTENLELIKRLWSGESVDADLPWCRLEGARPGVLPVQRPRPPVWMGATGERAVRRAARMADGWLVNPATRLDAVEAQLPAYREAREDSGRADGRPRIAAIREVFCAADRDRALEASRPYLEEKYRAYASWGQANALTDTDTLALDYEQLAEQRFIVGSPEDCYAGLREYRDRIGAEELILRCHWPGMPIDAAVECVQLLSSEVLPTLRQTS